MVRKEPRTISGTGRDRIGQAGLTLFEILIVLAIIALFTGVFVLRFDESDDERLLSSVSAELRNTAATAKDSAFAFRRDYYVVLGEGGFYMTDRRPLGDFSEGPPLEEPVSLPDGVEMKIRVGDDARWREPSGFIWHFRRSGLSDPVEVRFARGNSYVALDFPVLSGRPGEISLFD